RENALKLKQMLEHLNGIIEGLISLEVGLSIKNQGSNESDSDIVLYSEFTDQAALDHYQTHPEHRKIKPFAQSICSERRVVDYTITMP
ncbi:MAG: Dabb family protein, partial [Cocleimonas sp.]|nr:Dabb family protein [Cocleimonas sp.]